MADHEIPSVELFGGRVLVQPPAKADKFITSGKIVRTDAYDTRPTEGIVRIVDTHCPLALNAGDRVLFSDRAGKEKRINGEMYVLLLPEEIEAVVLERESDIEGAAV